MATKAGRKIINAPPPHGPQEADGLSRPALRGRAMGDRMNAPGSDRVGSSASPKFGPVSSCVAVETLKQRADFLRAAKAKRAPCPALFAASARA